MAREYILSLFFQHKSRFEVRTFVSTDISSNLLLLSLVDDVAPASPCVPALRTQDRATQSAQGCVASVAWSPVLKMVVSMMKTAAR